MIDPDGPFGEEPFRARCYSSVTAVPSESDWDRSFNDDYCGKLTYYEANDKQLRVSV